MTAMSLEGAKLDIGGVITGTFGVLRRNFGPFLGLTALMVGVPNLVVGMAMVEGMGLDGESFDFGLRGFGMMAVGGLLGLVTAAILQGALVYGTIRDLNGQPAGFGECLATGLRHLVWVILISILWALGVVLGLMLLLVPGLMLMTAWMVVVPARVAEGAGVIDAFGRSAELTRGSRWRIFALILIFMVFSWCVQLLLTPFSFAAMAASPQSLLIASTVVGAIASIVTTLVGAAGASVIYVELRRLKEGMTPNALAALFD